ncbi:MAG: hypothetical protein WA971_10565 [Microbacterium sp.]
MKKNLGINRRAVLKGAAWSVPVVAVAVAVPAHASVSGCDQYTAHVVPAPGGGNNKYLLTLTVTVPGPPESRIDLNGVKFVVKLATGHSFDGTTGQAGGSVSDASTTGVTVTGTGGDVTGVMLNKVKGGTPTGTVELTVPGCPTVAVPF